MRALCPHKDGRALKEAKTKGINTENDLASFSFGMEIIRQKDPELYEELLKILLLDHSDPSGKKNIIWASGSRGDQNWSKTIGVDDVSSVQPRAFKSLDEKMARVKTHAEVFTPFEIVSRMTRDLWEDREGHSKTFLEIACGEAPFITSRYDTATGKPIPLEKRVGILDRKFQELACKVKDDEEWIERAEEALKSVYGYEFQGDSLFIARVNVLDAFLENFYDRFKRLCDRDLLLKESNIISWNFWQMDGRTLTPPDKDNAKVIERDLFHQAKPCRVHFWNQNLLTYFSAKDTEERGGMKKFYAVLGNPPFDDKIEDTSAEPIYQYFMKSSFEVAEKVELITPAKFLTFNGKENKETKQFALDRLKDPHFKILMYEPNASKIFPNTDPEGGVCISLRDEKSYFDPIGDFIPFEELAHIKQKVWDLSKQSIKDFAFSTDSYQFSDKMHIENPSVVTLLSKGHKRTLATNIFDKLDSIVFFSELPPDANRNDYIKIMGIDNGKRRHEESRRIERYMRMDYIQDHPNLKKWKVFVPKSNGSGALGETLSTPLIGQPLIGQPLIGHTQSFISIGSFNTPLEAEACLKYIKSKFARVMLGILKVTQHNAVKAWKYVPWQDFSASSDIDWSQSVSNIDQQLYKKYGLSDEEIAFIESNVKEME